METDEKTKRVFSEVYAFLNVMEETDRNKIPKSLIKLIEEQKSKTYNPQYSAEIPIEEQNLKKETLAIIALLDLNYWCTTEEEKQKIRNELAENERKYQEELREKYNSNDIFKKKKEIKKEQLEHTEENSITIIPEEKWYRKLFHFLKEIFLRK